MKTGQAMCRQDSLSGRLSKLSMLWSVFHLQRNKEDFWFVVCGEHRMRVQKEG